MSALINAVVTCEMILFKIISGFVDIRLLK